MPIAGKPMIERTLDMLSRGGAEPFIVVVHPEDRPLIDHLRRPPWAEKVRLAYQERRLGMAHAVDCASPLIRETNTRTFLLASCDNLYPDNHVAALIARQREGALDAVLTLAWVTREEATATAVAFVRNGWVRNIIEKPDPESLPSPEQAEDILGVPSMYALSTGVLDYLPRVPVSPRGEREFPDALRLLIEDGGRVRGQLVKERMTLTCRDDLLAINRHVLRTDPSAADIQSDLPGDVTIVQPARIDAGARVGSGCEIGPEAYLEASCTVGAGAVVRRAVVLQDGHVEAGQIVEGVVIA
jgi:NDP-sugar pyrophosphorylase family protein